MDIALYRIANIHNMSIYIYLYTYHSIHISIGMDIHKYKCIYIYIYTCGYITHKLFPVEECLVNVLCCKNKVYS